MHEVFDVDASPSASNAIRHNQRKETPVLSSAYPALRTLVSDLELTNGPDPHMNPHMSPHQIRENYSNKILSEEEVKRIVTETLQQQSNKNCVEVAEHVKECPVCSKVYDNDKTVYIVIIVVLAIICILLLKRVLEL